MEELLKKLSVGQKVFLRAFFMLLGLFLLTIVFYVPALEMLALKDSESPVDLTTMHWFVVCFGLVFITLSIGLNKITHLFDLAIAFFRKITGTRKGGSDA